MRTITKTSPQGVAIEFVEYEPTTSARDIQHFQTMIELRREQQNRRDAKQPQRQPAQDGAA